MLNVPNEHKDNVTQIVSLQQVKRVGGSTILDVTPPVALSNWTKNEGADNVTYTTLFTSASLPLVHGSNEIQVVLTVNDETKVFYENNFNQNEGMKVSHGKKQHVIIKIT